jgi:hypothetical protein
MTVSILHRPFGRHRQQAGSYKDLWALGDECLAATL